MTSSLKLMIICTHGTLYLLKVALIGYLTDYFSSYDEDKDFEHYSQLYGTIGISVLCLCDAQEIFRLCQSGLRSEEDCRRKNWTIPIISYSIPLLPIGGLITNLNTHSLDHQKGDVTFLILLMYFISASIYLILTLILRGSFRLGDMVVFSSEDVEGMEGLV